MLNNYENDVRYQRLCCQVCVRETQLWWEVPCSKEPSWCYGFFLGLLKFTYGTETLCPNACMQLYIHVRKHFRVEKDTKVHLDRNSHWNYHFWHPSVMESGMMENRIYSKYKTFLVFWLIQLNCVASVNSHNSRRVTWTTMGFTQDQLSLENKIL